MMEMCGSGPKRKRNRRWRQAVCSCQAGLQEERQGRTEQEQKNVLQSNTLPSVSITLCIGCGKCVSVCPQNNIVITEQKARIGQNCKQCGACIAVCPRNAIRF